MPPYRTPEQGRSYTSKFVMVRDQVEVTIPDDIWTSHKNLIGQDRVKEVERLRVEEPLEVDAGIFNVDNYSQGVYLNANSLGLCVPVIDEARAKSVVVFQRESPGFEVRALPEFYVYRK